MQFFWQVCEHAQTAMTLAKKQHKTISIQAPGAKPRRQELKG
jgi:hypothetical protein